MWVWINHHPFQWPGIQQVLIHVCAFMELQIHTSHELKKADKADQCQGSGFRSSEVSGWG